VTFSSIAPVQNNEIYNDLIEFYEKYDSLEAKLLKEVEEVDEKKYEVWAEDLVRKMKQKSEVSKGDSRQTQNFKLLTEVPGSERKRVVNVPKGYKKDLNTPYEEDVRSSFYEPDKLSTTLVFSSGRKETWANESFVDLKETYQDLEYELEVEGFEWGVNRVKAAEDRLRSLKIRLDAIEKVKDTRNRVNHPEALNPWKNCNSLTTFPLLEGASEYDSDKVFPKTRVPETVEEILALDTVSFQLWAEDASPDQLEVLAKWEAPVSFLQRLLNFLHKIGL